MFCRDSIIYELTLHVQLWHELQSIHIIVEVAVCFPNLTQVSSAYNLSQPCCSGNPLPFSASGMLMNFPSVEPV